jgi:hypothetical protein
MALFIGHLCGLLVDWVVSNGLLDLLDLSSILWSFPWKIGFLNLPIFIKNSAVD